MLQAPLQGGAFFCPRISDTVTCVNRYWGSLWRKAWLFFARIACSKQQRSQVRFKEMDNIVCNMQFSCSPGSLRTHMKVGY